MKVARWRKGRYIAAGLAIVRVAENFWLESAVWQPQDYANTAMWVDEALMIKSDKIAGGDKIGGN